MGSLNESSEQHARNPRWRPLNRMVTSPRWRSATAVVVFLSVVAAFVYSGWNSAVVTSIFSDLGTQKCPAQCSQLGNMRETYSKSNQTSNVTCPSYFRWIHEDLRPWTETGITREMIERARPITHFRLVIVDGKAYVAKYIDSFQTRDTFTLWGIQQLLRLYPGRLPDLELMFNTWDGPGIRSSDFQDPNVRPPPLFGYCKADWSLGMVFPDWSFWGWVEVNIKPWKKVSQDIKEGNKRIKWKDRIPYAYWKGNPYVDQGREEFMKCNVNTRLYAQDWDKESREGYTNSRLEDQCTHRYKIYIEGRGWSVSERFILACDSMTLYVKAQYYDFFIRGMVPLEHYWPIRDNDKCNSLNFAVEWGNNHTDKAQTIGKAGSSFIHEDLKMELVYDYMFHLLNEYAKLLKFKPAVPPDATELCPEMILGCEVEGTVKNFMTDSKEYSPSQTAPCSLPPNDPLAIQEILDRKANATRQVEMWENEYLQEQSKHQL